jgi:HEAT repeat protein
MTKTRKEILAKVIKRERETPAYKDYRKSRDRAEVPILADLRAHGIQVDRLELLRASHPQIRSAIPILARWVPKLDDPGEKSLIVRMLSIPAATGLAGNVLFEEFHRIGDPESSLKWTIADALSVVSTADDVPKLLAIARDKQNGRARQMIVLGLKRFNLTPVRDLLIELLADDDVRAHAVTALGNLAASEAVPALTRMLSDPSTLVRREARKALKKIKKEGPNDALRDG